LDDICSFIYDSHADFEATQMVRWQVLRGFHASLYEHPVMRLLMLDHVKHQSIRARILLHDFAHFFLH
jgi:hypothetical protein